ncbi:DUF1493 family protein [Pseudomonadota bacterium]
MDIAKKLVAESLSKKPWEISAELRLFHDLGIDGDDAEELLIEVRDKHKVNFDEFNFSEYFGSEFGAGWRHIIHRWFGRYGRVVYNFKPLTVEALGRAIDRGVLK